MNTLLKNIFSLESMKVGISMAFVEIASHKLRSLLSILGVMLGVASLVAMLTLVGGVNNFLNKEMANWAGSVWFFERTTEETKRNISWSRSPSIRYSDGIELEKDTANVKFFYRMIPYRDMNASMNNVSVNISLYAVDKRELDTYSEQIVIDKGEWFSSSSYAHGFKECVISWHLAKQILEERKHSAATDTSSASLLGKNLIINDHLLLTVVGIFKSKDPNVPLNYMKSYVYLPVRTMQKYLSGFNPSPDFLRIGIKDVKNIQSVTEKIAFALQTLHRGVKDFEYELDEWVQEITSMLKNANILVLTISIISLIVGGLSIMNVMLSSISERIYEIGVRKALGANTLQIFIQFIIETVTLSMTGGFFGIGLGLIPVFFRDLIEASTEGAIVPTILASHLMIVVAVIVGIGVLFGIYPAVKAARLNPIEALRYE